MSGLKRLSEQLCPWLREPLASLEAALGEGRLGHAWLLAGPRGIGKLNVALTFAARLLDDRLASEMPASLEAEAAGSAMRERRAPANHHPDLHWICPLSDKSTIGVDQVRDVAASLALKGFRGGAKIVVMEPAEAMTESAANALLKTLEEPTEDTYLLLVSHQPGRLVSTIRSRCQTLMLVPPVPEQARAWLADLGPDATRSGWRAPVLFAERYEAYKDNNINKLYDIINDIYENKVDPLSTAEAWSKLDLELVLDTLTENLQGVLKARYAGSNSITDRPSQILHNAWPALTLRRLFAQLDATERLREQLGKGVNTELGLRVLLLGFQSDRELS